MMQRYFLIIASTILSALICVDIAVVDARELFESFNGRIGPDSSSWFEPSLWNGKGKVPTQNDAVVFDESDTYAAIDKKDIVASVSELIIGRSASSDSIGSVQLDLLSQTKLAVQQDMTIGELEGSDGSVYVDDNASIAVEGSLTVGSGGNGLLVLAKKASIRTGNLSVRGDNSGGGSKIVMGVASTLTVAGDKRTMVNEMIENGLIVKETMDSTATLKVGTTDGNTVVTVATEPPEPPISCENRGLKYRNQGRKNCKWVAKKKNKRCKLSWKKEKLSAWCPGSCNKSCIDDGDGNNPCADGTLKYKNIKKKNCRWVKRLTRSRCKLQVSDGVKVSEICKKTCGKC
ncbi:unnamed protein product [Pseudo-nitzschia multistriata]|uniref:ShKT domain-containing protein n=1 Tax=Pseudo-nitzschia multistriata TaxID=183589 RepID=A0A448Z7N2_9STRA|nr:unnamed protein product [Pseudo-nitzschia multistriata]